MATMKKFPKMLYVTREGERDGEYFNAEEDASGAENGVKVAVYQLVEIKTKRVTHQLG